MFDQPVTHVTIGIISLLLCHLPSRTVMHELLVTWCVISSISILLMFSRYSSLVYIALFTPYLFAVVYALARNSPASLENKEAFFSNFVMGGHRGSPYSAPENSLASFEAALKEGAQLVEFDLQLTKDGIPILMHDDNAIRTTGRNKKISNTLSSELVGYPLLSIGKVNGTIPTLDEAINFCVENNLKMLFDVKRMHDGLVKEMVRVIQEKNLYSSVIISSFSPSVPFYVKRHDPKILTGFTNRRGIYAYITEDERIKRGTWWSQWLLQLADDVMQYFVRTFLLPDFLGVDMLLLNHRDISQSLVFDAKKRGIKVVAWTVNDKAEINWMRNYLKIPVLTDYPLLAKN